MANKKKKQKAWTGLLVLEGLCQLADQLNQLKNDLAMLEDQLKLAKTQLKLVAKALLCSFSALCICWWFLTGPSLWYSWLSDWFSQWNEHLYGPNSMRLLKQKAQQMSLTCHSGQAQETAMRWCSKLRINNNLLEIWFASQQWQHCAKGTTQTAELAFSVKSKTLKGTTTSKQSKPWI